MLAFFFLGAPQIAYGAETWTTDQLEQGVEKRVVKEVVIREDAVLGTFINEKGVEERFEMPGGFDSLSPELRMAMLRGGVKVTVQAPSLTWKDTITAILVYGSIILHFTLLLALLASSISINKKLKRLQEQINNQDRSQ